MSKFKVTHNRAIWETTTFWVEVPDPLPEGYADAVEFVLDASDDCRLAALDDDSAEVASGDPVADKDSDITIHDEAGRLVHSEIALREELL